MFKDIVFNMMMLITLSIISGFISQKKNKNWFYLYLQGLLFGVASLIAMVYPYIFKPGLIFDGRSIMISLCAMFFGVFPSLIAVIMAIILRLNQGGSGAITGSLVILFSAITGNIYYYSLIRKNKKISLITLYSFGLVVHIIMLITMLTLPQGKGILVIKQIAFPVLIIYPITSLIIGKILLFQRNYFEQTEKLKAQEKQFRLVFDNNPDAIIWIDAESGDIIRFNQAILKLFEKTEEAIMGKHISSLYPSDENILFSNKFFNESFMSFPFIQEIEITNSLKDIKHIELTLTKSFIDNQFIIQGVFRDITETVKASHSFRLSEQRFRSIFEMVSMIGLILDTEGRIILCNEYLLKQSGWTREEIINENWFDLFIEEGTGSFIYKEVFKKSFSKNQFPTYYINTIRTKEGKNLLIEWNNLILYSLNGKVDGIACLGVNITERKQNEDLLLKQKNELLRYNEDLLIFNRLATGREIKMIELKKEINNLCIKYGETERYDLDFLLIDSNLKKQTEE